MASENYSLQFFWILLPPKVIFPFSKNIFFKKSSVLASGNLFSVQWKQQTLVQSFLFCCWGRKLKEKSFPASANHLFNFIDRRSFSVWWKYFSMNASLRTVETKHLASRNHSLYIEARVSESFFSVQWKRIFDRIFHTDYCRRIFALVETIYFT